jgi:hypothetical protein
MFSRDRARTPGQHRGCRGPGPNPPQSRRRLCQRALLRDGWQLSRTVAARGDQDQPSMPPLRHHRPLAPRIQVFRRRRPGRQRQPGQHRESEPVDQTNLRDPPSSQVRGRGRISDVPQGVSPDGSPLSSNLWLRRMPLRGTWRLRRRGRARSGTATCGPALGAGSKLGFRSAGWRGRRKWWMRSVTGVGRGRHGSDRRTAPFAH